MKNRFLEHDFLELLKSHENCVKRKLRKESWIGEARKEQVKNFDYLKNYVQPAYPESSLCTKQECLKHAIIHVRLDNYLKCFKIILLKQGFDISIFISDFTQRICRVVVSSCPEENEYFRKSKPKPKTSKEGMMLLVQNIPPKNIALIFVAIFGCLFSLTGRVE